MNWKEEFDKEFEMTFHNFDPTVIEIIHWKFKKFISTQIIEKIIEEVEDFDADNNHKLVKQLRKEFL